MTLTQVDRLLRVLVAEVEAMQVAERAAGGDWIDQRRSPLGPRRHVATVKARLAAGESGAKMIGRRALLSPPALQQELEAFIKRSSKPKAAPKPEGVVQRIEQRLGLVRGGAG